MDYLIKTNWWKWLSVILLTYTVVGGLLMEVPRLAILNETVRNLYFHVPMWFSMILLFCFSVYHALRYLASKNLEQDAFSRDFVEIGILFGILGLVTGMIWANYTWGEPWSNDPKQNGSAIAMLIYFAYVILRGSISDDHQRARISAVFNILAFATMIPLLFILPRLADSLHPGNGGNPGFNAYDLDNRMRLVFYPAVIGWFLLGAWIVTVRSRLSRIEIKKDYE